MSKGTFFTGQPIFNQLLSFIPRSLVKQAVRDHDADRYCKSFKTYEHLVTMLYAIFNRCDSLREVTTGLLAWEQRIDHLGMSGHPRRSTLSDANKRRSEEVFGAIYFKLLARHHHSLPDSRQKSKKNNLYIFDSTSISLFKDILKASGGGPAHGRCKGGIKVHTLLHSRQDAPVMIRYSPQADNDKKYLKEVHLPKGSMVVFDRGYLDYRTYNRFTSDQVSFVTRKHSRSVYKVEECYEVNSFQQQQGVQSDSRITLGYTYLKKAVQVPTRMVVYLDRQTNKTYEFITNNLQLAPATIANCYAQRWQIETFFKRIKQNYPLQYFFGDNENAIKIQIWCALIADLVLKLTKHHNRCSMAFSNMVGLVRMHLMTYMSLGKFLQSPEKSLLEKIKHQRKANIKLSLFDP